MTSLAKGPFLTRKDIYKGCVDAGHDPTLCLQFIPCEAGESELSFGNGKFKVFIPSDFQPYVGQYYLNQLTRCYGTLIQNIGVQEISPCVSLRVFLSGSIGSNWAPAFTGSNQIYMRAANYPEKSIEKMIGTGLLKDDPSCTDTAVIHELDHLLRQGINVPTPGPLSEGLATLAQDFVDVTSKQFIQEPSFVQKVVAGSVIPLSIDGKLGRTVYFFVSSIKSNLVTIIFIDGSADNPPTPSDFSKGVDLSLKQKQIVAWDDPTFTIAVEKIENGKAEVKIYANIGHYDLPWRNGGIKCNDASYEKNSGSISINGELYTSDSLSFGKQPFVPIGLDLVGHVGASDTYDTAYCFWRGLMNMCGEGVVKEYLKRADAIRQKNRDGTDEDFCWQEMLVEACDYNKNLPSYFDKFAIKYNASECLMMTFGDQTMIDGDISFKMVCD